MCYHKRLLYTSCHHIAWGPQIRPCNLQRAHDDGYLELGCETMFAHPLHSLCIQSSCKACVVRKRKTDDVAERVRKVIGELRNRVEKLEAWEKRDCLTGAGDSQNSDVVHMGEGMELGSGLVEEELDNEAFEMLSAEVNENQG